MGERAQKRDRDERLADEVRAIAADDAASAPVCIATQVQAYKLAWDTFDVEDQVEYTERAIEMMRVKRLSEPPQVVRRPRYTRRKP